MGEIALPGRHFKCPGTGENCCETGCRRDFCVLEQALSTEEPAASDGDTKRQMIYVPELCPDTFLLLFKKGETRNNWSLRDFSNPGPARVLYARDIPISLDDLWSKKRFNFDAPTHPVADLAFWHVRTQNLNRKHLTKNAMPLTVEPSEVSSLPEHGRREYPIIDKDRFDCHPKSRKTKDCERMRFSANSEDWVTWTAFWLLQRSPATWWHSFVSLARSNNPGLTLPSDWEVTPDVELWRLVRSPEAYERKSRERMRMSNNSEWVTRSGMSEPVEGDSEIDLMLRSPALLLFVEAKLGSDISMRTTYDPQRNQIVRNIDCVLEEAKDREPMFWMLVRDANPSSLYARLLEHYRSRPQELIRELDHHPAERVAAVVQNLSLILWRDLLKPVIQTTRDDSEEMVRIKNELASRIG